MLTKELFALDLLIAIRVKLLEKLAHLREHLRVQMGPVIRTHALQVSFSVCTVLCNPLTSLYHCAIGLCIHLSSVVLG